MINEKKLIEDLQKWTQDDLYMPKQFELLIKVQPKIHRVKIIDVIRKIIKQI